MENSSGKISFGFSKITKKPSLVKTNLERKEIKRNVELIDSIEGSQVTFQGKEVDEEKNKKLVIAVSNDQKTRPIVKLILSRRIKKELDDINKELDNTKIEPNTNETLEQRAAREIIEDLQKKDIKSEAKIFELPIHPDELPLEGAVESNIDDYDRIPISDFGKAMLRGMGWKEEEEKEKIFDAPSVRPKGLGLGADKVVKKQPLLIPPAQHEKLEIKKNACIKILAGKHKNFYGVIEGFDDNAGRVIVKLAIGAMKIVINQFMLQPISKQEYEKYGKILNSVKYEKFKNAENSEQKSRSISPQAQRDSSTPSSSRNRDKKSRSLERNSDKNGSRRDKSNRERSRERRSSREMRRKASSDSEDDKTNNRKYNEKHRSRSHDNKHRKRHSSSDSSSERHNSKKKSSKKHSKSSKKYSSPSRYSSDDERKHKRKYKRSKHHRERS